MLNRLGQLILTAGLPALALRALHFPVLNPHELITLVLTSCQPISLSARFKFWLKITDDAPQGENATLHERSSKAPEREWRRTSPVQARADHVCRERDEQQQHLKSVQVL